jgi:hypothetical protein
MSTDRVEQMIDEYLKQLRQALSSLSPDRREQIVRDVAEHVAEARAEEAILNEQAAQALLDRIGSPEDIALAFIDTSMDESQRLAAPSTGVDRWAPQPSPTVRAAGTLMYLGATASLVAVIVDWVTRNALKSGVERGARTAHRLHGAPTLTPSELNSSVTATLVMATILCLVSIGLWLFIAKATSEGQWSARIIGSALFALNTLILLIGPPDLTFRGPTPPPVGAIENVKPIWPHRARPTWPHPGVARRTA